MEEKGGRRGNLTIYICDLTHTSQQIASNTFPLGCGYIASKLKEAELGAMDVRIFKYPEDLNTALEEKMPDIIGFGNYVWNLNLIYAFAEKIKKMRPETVVVFGGPNYPKQKEQKEEFLKERPAINFYVNREGENAFVLLVKDLLKNDLSVAAVKKENPKSVDFLRDEELCEGELLPRVTDLDKIPSPYQSGIFDKFFDGKLMPLIQTDRGCPFTCLYCVEGDAYFCAPIARHSQERVKDDLRYIGRHYSSATGLFITNSNFGMYAEDVETAKEIAAIKKETGWPSYINVATGKENKDNVVRVAEILEGGLRISASVQSTDPEVLRNIRRVNLPVEALAKIAEKFKEADGNSYSEIILGLPGDTKEKFFKSVREMVELGLNFVLVYTLMLLRGSGIYGNDVVEKYGIEKKYRILPRCFGEYDILGERKKIAEIEEVSIANNTMSFADYLECRNFFLVVNLFYNDGIFEELVTVLKSRNISVFSWLWKIFENIKAGKHSDIGRIFSGYEAETKQELWDDEKDLQDFFSGNGNMSKFLSGELGSNLAYKYKAIALAGNMKSLHEAAYEAAKELMAPGKEADNRYLDELKIFGLCRKSGIFDIEDEKTEKFGFDFLAGGAFAPEKNISVRFFHDAEQKDIIKKNLELYGSDAVGLARILSRVYIKKLFKKTGKI